MPISPPAARLPSCDTSRATAAKSSPPRTRRSAACARSRRSPTTAWVALSGTGTMIWAMLNWALAPPLRRSSIRASISASLTLIRLATSRSRIRSTIIWSLMLERNFA